MALDATNRARTIAQLMRDSSLSTAGLTKPDLRAALNAIDDWIDANQTSFNAALPLPFRTTASPELKSMVFCYVLLRRNGRLHAEEDG
jgi:hypothetical protein